MKPLRLLILLLLVLGAQPVFAEDSLLSPETMNYIGYGTVIVALIVVIISMLLVLKAVKLVTAALADAADPAAATLTVEEKVARKKAERKDKWIRLWSLKPLSEEHTLIMEGEYDGIKELDNPTPAWFMYLFYATIAFGIGYLLVYHVFKTAPLQYEEYNIEVAQAAKEKAALLAKTGAAVDEKTVKLSTDPTVLSSGKQVFVSRCSPCHGAAGQGIIGPNLTDDYWLHGNKIADIFKTIKYGINTMPSWEKLLSPKEISDVANYVKSIHGTNPPNPKAPQGVKVTD